MPSVSVEKEYFGTNVFQNIYQYTLRNQNGVVVKIFSYGGIVTQLYVPDRNNNSTNIVLGFDDPGMYLSDEYINNCPYFGAIIGRYADRITGGRFSINGATFTVSKNEGNNHLNGGLAGLDKVYWHSSCFEWEEAAGVHLSYLSPDGEEGYPGNLKIDAYYVLNDQNELFFTTEAKTDKTTPINLTNNILFNLSGMHEDIRKHHVMLNAGRVTQKKHENTPAGNIVPAKKQFDFSKPTPLHKRIRKKQGGYNHYFIVKNDLKRLKLAGKVRNPKTGINVSVLTTKPGVLFYTGDNLDNSFKGTHNVNYGPFSGLGIIPKFTPNSSNNKMPPDKLLKPNQNYKHVTVYRFCTYC